MTENQKKVQLFLNMLVDLELVDVRNSWFYKDGKQTEFYFGGCSEPPAHLFCDGHIIGGRDHGGRLYLNDKPTNYHVDFIGNIHHNKKRT